MGLSGVWFNFTMSRSFSAEPTSKPQPDYLSAAEKLLYQQAKTQGLEE
jgi:hypothetical protein